MKRLMLATLLGTVAFVASAQDTTAGTGGDATAQVENAVSEETRAKRDARRDCLRYTGSLITAQRNRNAEALDVEEVDDLDRDGCVAANGRVYSREDLDRTGATDIADALRRLDPAIR